MMTRPGRDDDAAVDVVTCEEDSDDGSFMKQFTFFRSGLTFGSSSSITRPHNIHPHGDASGTIVVSSPPSPFMSSNPQTPHVVDGSNMNLPVVLPLPPPSPPPPTQSTGDVMMMMQSPRAPQQEQVMDAAAHSTMISPTHPMIMSSVASQPPPPPPLHAPRQPPPPGSVMPPPPEKRKILTLGDPQLLGNLHSIPEGDYETASNASPPNGMVKNKEHNNGTRERAPETLSVAPGQSKTSTVGMGSFGIASGTALHHDDDGDDEDDDDFLYTRTAAPDSRFRRYNVDVVRHDGDRAADIPLLSWARPHMRGFHLAWMSFFVAFFAWFAMTPLLSEIAISLDLSRREIFLSSVFAVLSSAVTRFWIGSLNDVYGARWIMCYTLVAAAVPTLLSTFLLQGPTSLYLLRLFIGTAGSSFVTSQYWTLSMFTHEIAGTATALVAGWGNLGGGVAQVVMGSLLFPLAKLAYGGSGFGHSSGQHSIWVDDDDDKDNTTRDNETGIEDYDRPSDLAWRTVLAFPGILCLLMAYVVIRYGDDTPKGNVSRDGRPESGTARIRVWDNLRTGVWNRNTLLLAFQYGCCFGVEITMTQAAALYFKDEFGQTTEKAAALASVFGWMNIFARGIGGFGSDWTNSRFGMRGRLWFHTICLLLEGGLVILFGYSNTLTGAMIVMVFFSIAVQAAEGSTYGIVPYVDSTVLGSIAGIVGAGGNIGGACFALLFASYHYETSFFYMGCAVGTSALWSAFIRIDGHCGLMAGKDSRAILQRRQQAKPPAIIMIPVDPQHSQISGEDQTVAESRVESADVDPQSDMEQNSFTSQDPTVRR